MVPVAVAETPELISDVSFSLEPLSQATHATFSEHGGGAFSIQDHIERLIAEPVGLDEPEHVGLSAFNDISSREVSRLAAAEARATLPFKIMTPRKKPLDLGDASHGRCASTPPMSPPPPPPRAEGNAREGARFRTPPPALGRPAPSGSEFSGKEAALVITSIADRVKRRTTRGSLATAHSTGSAPSSFNRTSFSLGRMKKEILQPQPQPPPQLAGRDFAAGLVGGGPTHAPRRLPTRAALPPSAAAATTSSRVLRIRPAGKLAQDFATFGALSSPADSPDHSPEPKRRRKDRGTTARGGAGRSPVAGIVAKVTDEELAALEHSDPAKYRRIVGNRKSAAASKARRDAAAEETAAALRTMRSENEQLLAKLAKAEAALKMRANGGGGGRRR